MASEFPLPDTEWEPTLAFWEAAARGRLVLPRCQACGTLNWYPREHCRACDRAGFAWTPVSGRGRLFSWAVVRHAFAKPFKDKIPYVTGLVSLEEDPEVRLVSEIVDCTPEELEVDVPVEVVFRPFSFVSVSRQILAPMFTPARAGSRGRTTPDV